MKTISRSRSTLLLLTILTLLAFHTKTSKSTQTLRSYHDDKTSEQKQSLKYNITGDKPTAHEDRDPKKGDKPTAHEDRDPKKGDKPTAHEDRDPKKGDKPTAHEDHDPKKRDKPTAHEDGDPKKRDKPTAHEDRDPRIGDTPTTHEDRGPEKGDKPTTHEGRSPKIGDSPTTHEDRDPEKGNKPTIHQGRGSKVGPKPTLHRRFVRKKRGVTPRNAQKIAKKVMEGNKPISFSSTSTCTKGEEVTNSRLCKKGWTFIMDECFAKWHTKKMLTITWNVAFKFCKEQNATLPFMDTEEKLLAVKEFERGSGKGNRYWLGFKGYNIRNQKGNLTFIWEKTYKQVINKDIWGNKQPNEPTSRDVCLYNWWDEASIWDLDCDRRKNVSIICRKKHDIVCELNPPKMWMNEGESFTVTCSGYEKSGYYSLELERIKKRKKQAHFTKDKAFQYEKTHTYMNDPATNVCRKKANVIITTQMTKQLDETEFIACLGDYDCVQAAFVRFYVPATRPTIVLSPPEWRALRPADEVSCACSAFLGSANFSTIALINEEGKTCQLKYWIFKPVGGQLRHTVSGDLCLEFTLNETSVKHKNVTMQISLNVTRLHHGTRCYCFSYAVAFKKENGKVVIMNPANDTLSAVSAPLDLARRGSNSAVDGGRMIFILFPFVAAMVIIGVMISPKMPGDRGSLAEESTAKE